ncbi:MAG: hypothetical protein J7576_12850 [Siphonobacter aquaeclarae]|nr:hypothetical protein [Siphonobacter aquaeclarae]
MQFHIQAYDHPDAAERRAATRPAHLARARELKAAGHFLIGGALLSDDGRMIGSVLIMDFPDEATLRAWLTTEPYVTGGVWNEIKVQLFRVADV